MSEISFISFCIEYYAEHINKPGDEVYRLFKAEKLLDFIQEEYEDLHGMSMTYLMQVFDEYLGRNEK